MASRVTAAAARKGEIQLTLGLLKPTVCAYQPDVSAVLKYIKAQDLDVGSSGQLSRTLSAAADPFVSCSLADCSHGAAVLDSTRGRQVL